MAARPLSIDDKAGKNVQTDAAKDVLRAFAALLEGYAGEWSAAALEPVVVGFTEERGLKLGQVRGVRRGQGGRDPTANESAGGWGGQRSKELSGLVVEGTASRGAASERSTAAAARRWRSRCARL